MDVPHADNTTLAFDEKVLKNNLKPKLRRDCVIFCATVSQCCATAAVLCAY